MASFSVEHTNTTSGVLTSRNLEIVEQSVSLELAGRTIEVTLGSIEQAIRDHLDSADPHAQYLTQSEADARYALIGQGGGGTADHGALTGLGDDDHPQYFNQTRGDARYSLTGHVHPISSVTGLQTALNTKLEATNIIAGTNVTLDKVGNNITINSTGSGGTTDHGALTGLTDDDHPQYLLADGSRNLTGNLTVTGSLTVDDALGIVAQQITLAQEADDPAEVPTKGYVDTGLAAKADTTYVDTQLATKSDTTHNHDGTYLLESLFTSHLLDSDPHPNYATDTDLTNGLATKADSVHTHAIADVTNLSTSLDAKLEAANIIAGTNVTLGVSGNDITINSTGAGGTTDHGALDGLADDDHPQYVLADGSRTMTSLAVTNSSVLRDAESPSATLGAELGTGTGLTQTVTTIATAYYQVGGAGVGSIQVDGSIWLPVFNGYSTFRATATSHTFVGTGGTDLSVRLINPGSVPAAVRIGNLHIRNRATNSGVGQNAHMSIGTGTFNTALGYNTQQFITSGSFNTALGAMCHLNLTSGSYNTAIGLSAQQNMTSGSYNTAIGDSAQAEMTTGQYNNAFGRITQRQMTSGSQNNAFGDAAQYSLTSGARNQAFGGGAQYSPRGNTANATTTASDQVAIGSNAGQSASGTGDGGIGIGRDAIYHTRGVAVGYQSEASGVDSIAIGSNATASTDNSVQIGNASNSYAFAVGDTDVFGYIDSRIWTGTQAQYDALGTYDPDILYVVTG